MSPCVCAKSDEKWSRCRNSDSVSPYQSLLPVDAHLAICRGPSPNLSKRITSGREFSHQKFQKWRIGEIGDLLRNAPKRHREVARKRWPSRFAGMKTSINRTRQRVDPSKMTGVAAFALPTKRSQPHFAPEFKFSRTPAEPFCLPVGRRQATSIFQAGRTFSH